MADKAGYSADSSADGATPCPRHGQWRKLMYVKQDFADNYVDTSFLQEMQKNVHVRTYDYWSLVRHSGTITQHGSSIIIFLCIFAWLDFAWMSATELILVANTMTLAGYSAWIRYIRRQSAAFRSEGKQTAKAAVLFLMTLLGLSPILKTLTEDTSSDTIWVLTVVFFLGNFVFNNYTSSDSANVPSGSGAVALNAAIFASVLLASRLPSKPHVFGFMSLAVNWFALFPILRRSMRASALRP